MTDDARPVRPPSAGWMVASALAVFLAVLAILAWQVRTGRDPALRGAAGPTTIVASAPRRILERRVVRRVIIERIVGDDGEVTRTPVVVSQVRSVPVPAPAPAQPQPAPAPLVTRTS